MLSTSLWRCRSSCRRGSRKRTSSARRVERARHEAELARRRFLQVDPDNRLVADSLEAEWNETLRALQAAREEYERRRGEDRLVLDEAKKAQIRELASDFPRLWRDPGTADRERKRMVRLILEDVTLVKDKELQVHVRFKGGATRSLRLPRPLTSWEQRQLERSVVAEIDKLLDDRTYAEVASVLNQRGVVSGTGKPFDGRRVNTVRRAYGLMAREERLRAKGLLTLEELAAKLGCHKETVKQRRRQGRLPVRAYRLDDDGRYMYEDPEGKAGPRRIAAARADEV